MLVFTCVYFIGWNKSVKIDACLAMLARCWWHIFSKDLPYLLMSSWRVGENFEKFVHGSLTLESQTCEQHILCNVRLRPPSPTSKCNHISWYQYIIWFIWYLAYDMIQIYEYYVTSLLDTCCMCFFLFLNNLKSAYLNPSSRSNPPFGSSSSFWWRAFWFRF